MCEEQQISSSKKYYLVIKKFLFPYELKCTTDKWIIGVLNQVDIFIANILFSPCFLKIRVKDDFQKDTKELLGDRY